MPPYHGSDFLSLAVDEQGVLTGVSSTGLLAGSIKVAIDDREWATVPSQPMEGSSGRTFFCDLPPVAPGTNGSGKASVIDVYGDAIASIAIPPRKARANGAGVPAGLPLGLCDRPFFAVPYISFDGAVLTITGSHLPPGGDPGALSIEFGEGVAYEFKYPLSSTHWAHHFWYWPNAGLSDFQVVIDLAASAPGSDPFTFRFKYAKGPQADLPEPYGRVWIPRDLGIVVGLPTDPTQLTRVQTWSDSRTVTLTGFNHFRAIEALLARHGVTQDGTVLLDWGCGHGRVARHFVREWTRATIIGMDVDAENVAWAARNLVPGRFVHSPLMPPCELETASVDAAFSISVMTHLALDVQHAWLAELARIVRPGGIVLMSFGGPAAVAWSSVWNAPAYFEDWKRDGIHADRPDPALDGKIEDSSYYRNVAQTHDHVRREWSRHFDVLEILPEAIGNLDFAVLRRRPKTPLGQGRAAERGSA